jgi:hypothetical protein
MLQGNSRDVSMVNLMITNDDLFNYPYSRSYPTVAFAGRYLCYTTVVQTEYINYPTL